MSEILPFLLCLIAGLSTLLGSLFIFIKGNKNKIITCALAFASGVMLSVSIFDLIPESLTMFQSTTKNSIFINITIFIIIGLTIPLFIDKILPTKLDQNSKLYKLGIFTMIAIIIHNIPEGIATYISSKTNIKLGISITIAIAMHNIPEGISIAMPVYYATKNKRKAIGLTFISGMSEPLGAILAFLFLKPYINNTIMGALFAIIAGIMTYISLIELLPTALQYKEKKKTIISFLIGILFMYVNHMLS